MQQEFQKLRITRANFLNLLSELNLNQLNEIPAGFNNNIIWNFGHLVVTQQLLCYKLAGAEMYLADELINKYRKDTKPEGSITQEEVDQLITWSTEFCTKMENDFEEGKLSAVPYHEYTTSYNITLSTVEEAISFNNVHEGLHLGYAMALRKLV